MKKPHKSMGERTPSERHTQNGQSHERTHPSRQYWHLRGSHGNMESLCLLCDEIVGTATDEWILLASEQHHACAERCTRKR